MLSVIAQYSKSNEDSLHDTQHNLADHEPLYTLKKFAATWTDKLHLSMHQCRKSGWLKRVFTTFAAFPADKKIHNLEHRKWLVIQACLSSLSVFVHVQIFFYSQGLQMPEPFECFCHSCMPALFSPSLFLQYQYIFNPPLETLGRNDDAGSLIGAATLDISKKC